MDHKEFSPSAGFCPAAKSAWAYREPKKRKHLFIF